MKTKRPVKLIKRRERAPRGAATVALPLEPNRWSTAVRSWVVEFQGRDRIESRPAFDSLFKDAPLRPEETD